MLKSFIVLDTFMTSNYFQFRIPPEMTHPLDSTRLPDYLSGCLHGLETAGAIKLYKEISVHGGISLGFELLNPSIEEKVVNILKSYNAQLENV